MADTPSNASTDFQIQELGLPALVLATRTLSTSFLPVLFTLGCSIVIGTILTAPFRVASAVSAVAWVSFPLDLIALSIGVILQAGLSYALLEVVRGEGFDACLLVLVGLRRSRAIVTATFIYAVIVSIGTLLLVIPGIVAALGLSMAPIMIIDRDLEAVDALKASWAFMDGQKVSLAFALVISIGLVVASSVVWPLTLLVTVPFAALITPALFYLVREEVMSRNESNLAISG